MKDKTIQIILIIAICTLIVLQALSLILPRVQRNVSNKTEWRVIYSCGSCGYLSDTKWRYCPICGADMGGNHGEVH